MPEIDFSQPAPDYGAMVDAAAKKHGVDPDLAMNVVQQGEWYGKDSSRWNPRARSPKGATGIMQLMPDTGRRFGATDLTDPAQNIDAGVRYLKTLSDRYRGDWRLTAAAYNAGEGRVKNRVPRIKETQDYVNRVAPDIDFTKPAEQHSAGEIDFTKPAQAASGKQALDISKLPKLQVPESQRPGYYDKIVREHLQQPSSGLHGVTATAEATPNPSMLTEAARSVYDTQSALPLGIGSPGGVPLVGKAISATGQIISGIPEVAKDVGDFLMGKGGQVVLGKQEPTDDPVNRAMEQTGQAVTNIGERLYAGAPKGIVTDIQGAVGEAVPMIVAGEAGLPGITAQTYAQARGAGESAPKAGIRTAANIAGLGAGQKLATKLGGSYLAKVLGYTVGQETVTQIEQAIEQGKLPDPKEVGISTFKNALFNAGFAIHGQVHDGPRSTAHTPLGEAHDPVTLQGEVEREADSLPSQIDRVRQGTQDYARVADPSVTRDKLPVKKGELEAQGIGVTKTPQGWFAHRPDRLNRTNLRERVKAEAEQQQQTVEPIDEAELSETAQAYQEGQLGSPPQRFIPQPRQGVNISRLDQQAREGAAQRSQAAEAEGRREVRPEDESEGGQPDARIGIQVQREGGPLGEPRSPVDERPGLQLERGEVDRVRDGQQAQEAASPQTPKKANSVEQMKQMADDAESAEREEYGKFKEQQEEVRRKRIEEGRKFRMDCSRQGGAFTIPGV